MGSTHGYDREGFLTEFFPDAADRAEVEAGAQALINVREGLRRYGEGPRAVGPAVSHPTA